MFFFHPTLRWNKHKLTSNSIFFIVNFMLKQILFCTVHFEKEEEEEEAEEHFCVWTTT